MIIALRLAKEGYAGGDPLKVLQMDVDVVLMALNYQVFLTDYERAFYQINREEG